MFSMIGDLTEAEIEEVLKNGSRGHLGCAVGDDLYVVPIFYVYHDGQVFGHTYEGKKIDMMRKNSSVCLQVDAVENLWEWQSVIGWGEYEELSGKDATHALALLAEHLNRDLEKEIGRAHV